MSRALLAGLALGIAAGLLFVFHDSLALSVSWPVLVGFAMWEMAGRRGARGALTALAAAIGVGVGYGTFALVSEFLPITTASFGVAVGVAVGLLVIVGLLARERLPMPALLLGYAAFLGVFEPQWIESPAAIRTHGIEALTVTLLGLLIGILAATLVRAVADRVQDAEAKEEERERAEARGAPVRDMAVKGGAS